MVNSLNSYTVFTINTDQKVKVYWKLTEMSET